jgi:hypothetical protein
MAQYAGDALSAHAKMGCYLCGRGDRLVSTEVQIEGEGILAICTGCIQDLAQAGRLTFNEAYVQELRSELATTKIALEDAQRLEARLQAALRNIQKPAARR